MLTTTLMSISLFVASVASHLWAIATVRRVFPNLSSSKMLPKLLAFSCLVLSHLWTAGLFTIGFAAGCALEVGGFTEPGVIAWMDLFNYSVINMTTLGLADFRPVGHLRFMAGIESLTGFILISCTAQVVYFALEQPPPAIVDP